MTTAEAQAILEAGDPAHPQWLEAWQLGPTNAVEAMKCVLLSSRRLAERLRQAEAELGQARVTAALALVLAVSHWLSDLVQWVAWLGQWLGQWR